MRIGMILERDFPTTPPDIRVEKECDSLLAGGHEVHLLSLKITSPLNRDKYKGINIARIPIPMHCIKDWTQESVEKYFHSHDSPWNAALEEFILKNRIDVLHVHDLPLVWPATHAAQKTGIPVVFDMHEVYPPMVEFMRPTENGGWNPADWIERYEKDCLERSDRVIVTVEESKQRLLDRGISGEKIVVVMNTERIENMKTNGKQRNDLRHLNNRLVVSYVGAFGEVRGLEQLIYALDKLRDRIPPMHLLLVGSGYNQSELERLTIELELEDRVTITGWVGFEEIPYLVDLSDICVVPHIKNDFTDTTVPHKLFQYMLKGKPIVVSDIAPLQRIVNECDCGGLFHSGDVDGLVRILALLAGSSEMRDRLGKNGLRMALNKYNWTQEEERLLNLYQGFNTQNAHVSGHQ